MSIDRRPVASGAPGNGARRSRAVLGVAIAVGFVAAALTAVFGAAGWYADRVALTRYCDDPSAAVLLVRRILTETRPAGSESTQPYLLAAKLLYLVPQADGETLDAYSIRLGGRIESTCPRGHGRSMGLGDEATDRHGHTHGGVGVGSGYA